MLKQPYICAVLLLTVSLLHNANAILNWHDSILDQLDSLPHHAEDLVIKSYIVRGTNDYEYDNNYMPAEKRIEIVQKPKHQQQHQNEMLAQLEEYFRKSEKDYADSIIRPISDHLTYQVMSQHKKQLQKDEFMQKIEQQLQQIQKKDHEREDVLQQSVEQQFQRELENQKRQRQQQQDLLQKQREEQAQKKNHQHNENQIQIELEQPLEQQEQQQQQQQQQHQEKKNQSEPQHEHQQHGQEVELEQEKERFYWFRNDNGAYDHLNNTEFYIQFDKPESYEKVHDVLKYIANISSIPFEAFHDINIDKNMVLFRVLNHPDLDSATFLDTILKYQLNIDREKKVSIEDSDLAYNNMRIRFVKEVESGANLALILTIIFVPILLAVGLAFGICLIRKRSRNHADDEETLMKEDETMIKKQRFGTSWVPPLAFLKRSKVNGAADQNNELCRQQMNNPKTPMNSTLVAATPRTDSSTKGLISSSVSTPISLTKNDGNNNEDSAWTKEWMNKVNIDINTGHVILKFMEKHLNDKNLLNREWNHLCTYEADLNKIDVGKSEENSVKNRFQDVLPYDHNRVKLKAKAKKNDYINASYIIDDDPKNPSYIAAQSPLDETCEDFWQMIWQTDCAVIVSLCSKSELENDMCTKYWPDADYVVYGKFEVHLVSIHIWCDDYLIRNFLIKNRENNETKAITQFHFLEWPSIGTPSTMKVLLEFRRKVKKSQSNDLRPIIVHCNDGVGRTGCYILIDMVVNKILKGAKEIDLSATLEYLRDQRPEMVKYKYLFEYAFEAVTEELKNMLNL